MCSSIEDSEVVLVFERNNAGLKKLCKVFVWTDKRLICLLKCNVSFKVMYSTVNSIFHVSIRINCNRVSEVTL
jgi:hypothetical protein